MWQREQVQAGEHEQGKRQQWRIGNQGWRLLSMSNGQGDEVGNDGSGEGNRQPAVRLPAPVFPVHFDPLPWINFHPFPEGSRKPASTEP